MKYLGKGHIWHPYTQMKDYEMRDLLFIDRAQGLFLYDREGKPYYDTISSWWCILHGHGHPVIREAIRRQLYKLEHVLLAGVTHEPAERLAEKLIRITPPSLTKVFYSDNGSTACEIALKMSLQYWRLSGKSQKKKFVALERGYHGDTIGTMSLGGTPGFHGAFADLFFDSHRVPSPYCYRCPAGKTEKNCCLDCIEPLGILLHEKKEEIAGLIMEPIIQAAGGMIIYPESYLREAARLAKEAGIHLILDEVATGFGRTGSMFALEKGNVVPDFLCLSKGLTAGFLPMAATLATDEIYQAFHADYEKNRTFYHGHTYTGNPLAAAAALGSLQVFDDEKPLDRLSVSSRHLHARMERFLKLPWVGDLRQVGMISALELVRDQTTKEPFSFEERVGWKIFLKGLERGLLLRPLGNVVYLWLPLSTTQGEIDDITDRMWDILADGAIVQR